MATYTSHETFSSDPPEQERHIALSKGSNKNESHCHIVMISMQRQDISNIMISHSADFTAWS